MLTCSFWLRSDNVMTDIYGANLYSRYLAQQQALTTQTEVVAQGIGKPVEAGDQELVSSAAECRSILVGLNTSRKTRSHTSGRSDVAGAGRSMRSGSG